MNRRLLALAVLLTTTAVQAQDWPRFRGPNGSGVGDVKGFLPRWTDDNRNWKVKLPGVGHSSPIVWGDRLYVTCGDEVSGKRTLLCLEPATGKTLWQRDFPGERHRKHGDNSFASATPAADAKHVYVCWGGAKEYLVVALDHDGKESWRTDLGPFRAGHGFGPSPIVHDGLVIVPNDQDGAGALVGLDAQTGKERWKVPRKSKATYTTPCVFTPPGKPAEVIFTNYEHGVTSVDPQSGKVNWELDVFDKRHVETSIGSPVVAGDKVLALSGWLGVRMEVVAVGFTDKAKEAWRITRSAPLCTTPLVVGELVYLWSDGGMVTCADVRSGEVHWRERVPGSYYSSPVCVGKYLVNLSREGDGVVIEAGKTFKVLARNTLDEGSHATPAIAGGRLFVRTFAHLSCYGGK